MFTMTDAYRTAQRCRKLDQIYTAAADPQHPDNLTAISTIQLMAADARGERSAFGAREVVMAGVNGWPMPKLITEREPMQVWLR